MLKHPTLDQFRALGLYGMAKAFTELAEAKEAKELNHTVTGLPCSSSGRPPGGGING